MTVDPYRLPRTVTPTHYELAIAPDLGTCRFEGTTAIAVTVHEPVGEIVLNAVELELHSAVVTDASGRQQEAGISPRRGAGAGDPGVPGPAGDGSGQPDDHQHRHDQRPAARVLPEHLHRR